MHTICGLFISSKLVLTSTYFSGAFRLYDVDNDGYITREEMYNIVDAIYQMVVCIFSNKILHLIRRVQFLFALARQLTLMLSEICQSILICNSRT